MLAIFDHPKNKENLIGKFVIFQRTRGEEWTGEIMEVVSDGVYHVSFEDEGEEKGKLKYLFKFYWKKSK